ncbi:hypothetical protein SPRG_13117 [Saprolegnia parasitica CBS 223.65]|uniref:Uncharacterized protein n=1 Tax=Saprolegnia parasitica (strain CBS 223.65) TaxID=695850 RepID=A0A067BYK8_SAPPC|nr:hypothetical protein SPRG_13117 [Saprolegnia parasitica CBS 223.65]KDO21935.1 hypothetical protein SPRG_13117 [Saprolegnia parasitica CBS 223.65]|eukprot:XP_012207376.1 hypothetical protein SPRG_13117 [Saprolegnia parasitica CBS 223.65]
MPALQFYMPSCVCPRPTPFEGGYDTPTRLPLTLPPRPIVLPSFPHECPTQTPRGALAVEFALANVTPDAVAQHVVFLRFEPAASEPNALRVGDQVPCACIVDDVQSTTHPTGTWLPSQEYVFDQATGLAHCTYVPLTRDWSFSWSQAWPAATLTAYLFVRRHDAVLQVVASARSPAFAIRPTPPSPPASPSIDASLGVILAFVSALPPGVGGAIVSRHVQSQLLHPLFARLHMLSTEMYRDDHARILPLAVDRLSVPVTTLEATCLGVATSLFDPSLVQQLQALCLDDADCLLDKDRLTTLFQAWKTLLAAYIDQWLQRYSRYDSHTQLVLDVKAVAPHLHSTPSLFEPFVAQLRELYMAKAQPQEAWPLHQPLSPFDGRWLCAILPPHHPGVPAPVLPLLQWVTMAYCFRMHLDVHNVLHVRSDLAIHSTIWSTYILDDRLHVARVFPNGANTLREWSASWLHGDYTGHVRSPGVICLTFYAWPLQDASTAYIARVQMTATTPTRLQFQWSLASSSVTPDADFVTMTTEERQACLRETETPLMALDLTYHRVQAPGDGYAAI